MSARALLAVVITLLAAAPAAAWDDITHGYISERAIGYVRTPELRTLLETERDALLSGSEFPDWGHSAKPFGEISHSPLLDSYRRVMLRPETRGDADWNAMVAHYLGVHAHTVQDRLLDATMKKRRGEVGEPRGDDMENGVYLPAALGYLRQRYALYLPESTLVAAYEDGGFLAANDRDPDQIGAEMRAILAGSETVKQQLKLLSYLSSDYVATILPWGAANLETAPGGIDSCARATAAMWEALWAELQGAPAPWLVYSEPEDGGVLASADASSAYGRITLVTRRRVDVPALTPDLVRLTNANGRRIDVSVHTYIDIPGHDTDVAIQIEAAEPWTPGAAYVLEIAPGAYLPADEPRVAARLAFAAPQAPRFMETGAPRHGWRMGLYLFALLGGLGLFVFGAPDVVRLAVAPRGVETWRFRLVNAPIKLVGLALVAAGAWSLATDGAWFVEFLRAHH